MKEEKNKGRRIEIETRAVAPEGVLAQRQWCYNDNG